MQKDATVLGRNGKEYKLGHDGLLLNPDSSLEYGSTDYYDENKEKNKKDNIKAQNAENNINNSDNTEDKKTTDNKSKSNKGSIGEIKSSSNYKN